MPDEELPFKVGDTVVRIGPTVDGVTEGNEYVVRKVSLKVLWLVGVDGVWHINKFKLAKWVPKVGDSVTINNDLLDGWPFACGPFSKTYQLQKNYTAGPLENPDTGNKENLWELWNDNEELFWVADHQLIRADGIKPSVPQRKKRIYNAISS